MRRTSLWPVYLCGIVLVATVPAGCATPAASATVVGAQAVAGGAVAFSRNASQAPSPSDAEKPVEEAEPNSSPSESSNRGEEHSESSDGENPFVDGRHLATWVPSDTWSTQLVAPPWAFEPLLNSQFQPDGLERPPRA